MSGVFFLSGNPDERLRLKSFGAVTRGPKTTLKIELETVDPHALAFALSELAAVQEGQKPPKPAARKRSKKSEPLALPAPARALPKPDGAG